MSIIYPPKNSVIVFREPFFRREFSGQRVRYYIRAIVNGMPEKEIRVVSAQQKGVMDELLRKDLKLTNAVVMNTRLGVFKVISSSPQRDFFKIVKEEKECHTDEYQAKRK